MLSLVWYIDVAIMALCFVLWFVINSSFAFKLHQVKELDYMLWILEYIITIRTVEMKLIHYLEITNNTLWGSFLL